MFKIGDKVTPTDTFDPNYGETGTITNIINGKLLSSIHKDTYEVQFNLNGGNILYLYSESSLQLMGQLSLFSPKQYTGKDIQVTILDKNHPLYHLNGKIGTVKSMTYLSKTDYFDVEVIGEPGYHILHTSEFKILEDPYDLFGDLFNDEPTIKTKACPPHEKSASFLALKDKNYEQWFYCKICGIPMERFEPLKKLDSKSAKS
jgi:hypothetical protein